MTTRKTFCTFIFRIYSHTQRTRMFVITTHSLFLNNTRELNNLCHICEICHKFRKALLQTSKNLRMSHSVHYSYNQTYKQTNAEDLLQAQVPQVGFKYLCASTAHNLHRTLALNSSELYLRSYSMEQSSSCEVKWFCS
jgi:hypothetical protein